MHLLKEMRWEFCEIRQMASIEEFVEQVAEFPNK